MLIVLNVMIGGYLLMSCWMDKNQDKIFLGLFILIAFTKSLFLIFLGLEHVPI